MYRVSLTVLGRVSVSSADCCSALSKSHRLLLLLHEPGRWIASSSAENTDWIPWSRTERAWGLKLWTWPSNLQWWWQDAMIHQCIYGPTVSESLKCSDSYWSWYVWVFFFSDFRCYFGGVFSSNEYVNLCGDFLLAECRQNWLRMHSLAYNSWWL